MRKAKKIVPGDGTRRDCRWPTVVTRRHRRHFSFPCCWSRQTYADDSGGDRELQFRAILRRRRSAKFQRSAHERHLGVCRCIWGGRRPGDEREMNGSDGARRDPLALFALYPRVPFGILHSTTQCGTINESRRSLEVARKTSPTVVEKRRQ